MQKPFISALLLALLAFGCTKSDNNLKPSATTWIVSYYLSSADKIEDTSLFTGYTFEFNDNNVWLIHKPDGSTVTARWKTDGTITALDMDNPVPPVDEILGNWDVTLLTDSGMKMIGQNSNSTSVFSQMPEIEFKKQ